MESLTLMYPVLGRECLVWLCVWHKLQVTKLPCCTGVMVSVGSGSNMYRHMVMALLTYLPSQNLISV